MSKEQRMQDQWKQLLYKSRPVNDLIHDYDEDHHDMLPPLKPGDQVRLNTPDNIILHGAPATIAELTPWGAHVHTAAAATGKYRASHNELERGAGPELMSQGVLDPDTVADTPIDLIYKPSTNGHAKLAKDKGYTGDVCDMCGGINMLRKGPCLVCCDCGATGGCG